MTDKQIQEEVLKDSINYAKENTTNNESAAITAADEAMFVSAQATANFNKEELAEKLNKEFDTDLTKNDLEKIEDIIFENNKGNIDFDFKNATLEDVNNAFEKINNKENEKNEANEEKEGLLDKAKEAISNKFEELQQAAQDVDLHSALRNSDNAFDRAQADFFDQVDQFTQELHNNKKEQAMQDKQEEKYVEIPLKSNEKENENNNSSNFKEEENKNINENKNDNDKDLNLNNKENNKESKNYVNKDNEKEEGINKETQEKLEQKAEQAEKTQEKEQNQENQAEKSAEKAEKVEKEAEVEASH